jgi:hypothetical protein
MDRDLPPSPTRARCARSNQRQRTDLAASVHDHLAPAVGVIRDLNRLPRQYLAKGADLRRFSLRDVDDIARRINTRPRRVLDWAASAELFWPHVHAECVR